MLQLPDGVDGNGGDGIAALDGAAELDVNHPNVGVQVVGNPLALGALTAGVAGARRQLTAWAISRANVSLPTWGGPTSR